MNNKMQGKIINYYKRFCKGDLSFSEIINEMAAAMVAIDNCYVKQQPKTELQNYYTELEYILFDVMKYEQPR